MFLDGSVPAWQVGQVLGLLSLFVTLIVRGRFLRVPKGQRLRARSTWLLLVMTAFTVWMATLYVVDSRPLYEARSRLSESFDVVEAATGLERTDESNYPRIVSVLADRPDPWPPNCMAGRVTGIGNVRLNGLVTPELQQALTQSLQDEGFEAEHLTREEGGWVVVAIRGDESCSFSGFPTGDGVVSVVDFLCGGEE